MRPIVLSTAMLLTVAAYAAAEPPRIVYSYANNGLVPFPGPGWTYQLGYFDLANPTGAAGSYAYAWTSVGSPVGSSKNLFKDPVTGQMYIETSSSLRALDADGTVGPSLATVSGSSSVFGRVVNRSGELISVGMINGGNALTLTDTTSWTETATASTPSMLYSQFGGGLAMTSSGNLFFANYDFSNPSSGKLVSVGLDGSLTNVGVFSGTDFNHLNWMNLFADGDSLYLLNGNRLYTVSTTDAALTQLGVISNLPAGFDASRGFTGTVGTLSSIPEPSTYGLMLGALVAATSLVRRVRRGKSGV